MGPSLLPPDVRHAFRSVLSGRLFTGVAVACLALGIATNTAMFSVFDAMFLRPLPFRDADRLVSIAGRHPETGRRVSLSLDDLRAIASAGSLDEVAAYSSRASTLTDGGDPERVGTQLVSSGLFSLLGIQPARGRGFEASDDVLAAEGAVLISDSLWRRRYDADPAALGRLVRIDGVPHAVVGVMPPGFRFPSTSEMWIPMTPALGASGAASRSVSIVGRLSAGTSVESANAELATRTMEPVGSRSARIASARSYAGVGVGGEERVITGALMGATTVLLLIACVNVANLLLARGTGRRREIAVRAALGASRARIIRQLLTESVILAALACAAALPLAWYGIRWVHDAVPPTDPLGPYYIDWSLDARALGYTVAVTLVIGLAFGLAPAFDAAGRHLLSPLRDGVASTTGRVQRRTHSALIVAQVALAVVLVGAAALFVRTYVGLRNVELGYDTAHLMTARVYLSGPAYERADARARFVDELAAALGTLAGAHGATVTDLVPLDDQGGSDSVALVEGRNFEEGREPTVHYAGVAGRWLETFDLRLTSGRTFHESELLGTTPAALVNEELARTFWPGQNPIGRRFRMADDESIPWLSVIGVVPDIRTVKLDESRATPPTAWIPHRLISTPDYGIVIRTQATPESVTPGLRAILGRIDPDLALFDVYSMEQVRWLSYWMYVMWGTLFGVFAVVALFVAAVGVYGVVHYTVAQRTREIGLRVALGARRAQVVGPMLRHVGALVAVGVALGLVGAVAVTPFVGSLLIGVEPNDPALLGGVSLLLAAVALVATWLPAWRASAVDPVAAFREG